jgi:uncharacterized protein
MPKPHDGESKEEFMGRCIPQLIDEGKEQDQAVAVCSSLYDNKDKAVGEINMETKYFSLEVKSSDKEERTLEGIATSQIVDRDGDVVMVDGIDLKNFKKNPLILWAHDYSSPPIGKATKIWKEDKDLKFKMKFVEAETYPFAETIYKLFAGGYINSFSMGFRPDVKEAMFDEKNGGYVFNKSELIEISAVPLPSNTSAVAVTVKGIEKAFEDKAIDKTEFDSINESLKKVQEELLQKEIEDTEQEMEGREVDIQESILIELSILNDKIDDLVKSLENTNRKEVVEQKMESKTPEKQEQNNIESYIDKIFMEIQEDRSNETQDHSQESSFEEYCKDVIKGLVK